MSGKEGLLAKLLDIIKVKICLKPMWHMIMSSIFGGAWGIAILWLMATNLCRALYPGKREVPIVPSESLGFQALAQPEAKLLLTVSQLRTAALKQKMKC